MAPENDYTKAYSAESYQIIKPCTCNYFSVEFELNRLVSNCNSENTQITPCLEKAYNNLFGSDYNHMVERMKNMSETALDGKDALTALTGCKQPCESVGYEIIPILNWNIKHDIDPNGEVFMDGNFSTIIGLTHNPKSTIKLIEEMPRSTCIKFISDIGGIMGVFLGISFWSLYQIIVHPFLEMLQKIF